MFKQVLRIQNWILLIKKKKKLEKEEDEAIKTWINKKLLTISASRVRKNRALNSLWHSSRIRIFYPLINFLTRTHTWWCGTVCYQGSFLLLLWPLAQSWETWQSYTWLGCPSMTVWGCLMMESITWWWKRTW